MKQMTFSDAEYAVKRKQTRKELFLIEMDEVVPWKGLIALIDPHYPKGEGGRPAYPLMVMLRIHLMQNWFGYSDPTMEEALYETYHPASVCRVGSGVYSRRNHPSQLSSFAGKTCPEMHQTRKGNQYYFGMKAHIGVDNESGLVHSMVGTAANVADVTQVDKLLHGAENVICADAGYTGVEKRPE